MKRLIRYKVRPDQAEKNVELVGAVYDELASAQPAGLRYATFRLEDGVTFLHLVSVETDDGESPLPDLPSFQRFQDGIADRCTEVPAVTELTDIGSFRMFDS